jgi:hypothetical protein
MARPNDKHYYEAPRGLLGKLFLAMAGNATSRRQGDPLAEHPDAQRERDRLRGEPDKASDAATGI